MKKIYQLLEWLGTTEARRYLLQLTGESVSSSNLLQFCASGQCAAYIDCGDAKGEQNETALTACADGAQKLIQPELMTAENVTREDILSDTVLMAHRPLVAGAGWLYPEDSRPPTHQENLTLRVTAGPEHFQVMFKSADIRALADKINGASWQPGTREPDALRAQLEWEKDEALGRERQVRQQLDQVTESRRADLKTIKNLTAQLEQERRDRKNAESEIAALRKQLEGIHSPQNTHHSRATSQEDLQPQLPDGLTFPYETKELKAMHTAALKYWANYSPDKRQPTQKEIGHELCDLLGLARQANNEPARKAIGLATAIRPDTLPGT